jgi:hypothetical protein
MHHPDYFVWDSATGQTTLGQGNGQVTILQLSSHSHPVEFSYVGGELSNPEEPRLFQPAIDSVVNEDDWDAHFAHWFLILAFLIPWSAFLGWRWRRQRILTKVHDAAAASLLQ